MSDTLVLVVTALVAVGTPAWTLWGIWRLTRRAPTRPEALSHVLGSATGTALLGLVLPAVLLGALDPVPAWLAYVALSVTSASLLAWRWDALAPGRWASPSLVATSTLLTLVLAVGALAVT